MPDAREFQDAVLADRVDVVEQWLRGGIDADMPLDERGATPLFFACTPGMVRALLDGGAEAMRVLADGVSVLDAAAQEGQVEIARELLRRAPGLATEERALMAADHPGTEALIRAVARGDTADSVVLPESSRVLRLRPEPLCTDPRAPGIKGSLHSYDIVAPGEEYTGAPYRPGELARDELPDWAQPHVPDGADVFAGPGGSVLVFPERDDHAPPVLVRPDGPVALDVPPVPLPHVHAFDAAGEHFFFGYGQAKIIGVRPDGQRILDLDLPGAGWGVVWGHLDDEDPHGHDYPARIAVVDDWLVSASLERIHVIGFGDKADVPVRWYTCQFGTCVAPALDGRVIVVGARAGGAVFGRKDREVVRLADLEPPRDDEPSPLRDHLRMALRVTGFGLDDPRWLEVEATPDGAIVSAAGLGGFVVEAVDIPGLHIDPIELEPWPGEPEIVDAFELDGAMHLRAAPVGSPRELRSYVVEGLDQLWDRAFAPRPAPVVAPDRLTIARTARPRDYDPPHPDIGTLAYFSTGPAGYGWGHQVSPRPGFWQSYVVDSDGVHPLEPQWYSGVTYDAFHDELPLLVAATGREAIEVDLTTRRWRRHEFDRAVRGVCYFGTGVAVLLTDELLLLPDLEAEPEVRLPTTTRHANLGSYQRHRVLWVPVGDDGNVFLTRAGEGTGGVGGLSVVAVVRANAVGGGTSPDGDMLNLDNGSAVARIVGWDGAIEHAVPWRGQPLHLITEPRVELT
jgi:hypothetical protein